MKMGAIALGAVVTGMRTPKMQIGVVVGGLGAWAFISADHMSQMERTQEKMQNKQLKEMSEMNKILEPMHSQIFQMSAQTRKTQGQSELAMTEIKMGKMQERHCIINILSRPKIRRSSWLDFSHLSSAKILAVASQLGT